MANINNQGVLFESIDPVNQVAYIAISTSWLKIYEQAAQKLLNQWNSLDPKATSAALGENYSSVEYHYGDLNYYWSQTQHAVSASQDFKTFKLFKIEQASEAVYRSPLQFFSTIHRSISLFLNDRNMFPKYKSVFPKIDFPILRFRRATFPGFIYNDLSAESDSKIKVLIKHFDQPSTIQHQRTFTPDRRFIKDRALGELLEPICLYEDHLSDLTAIINHLLDIKHFTTNNIDEILEQIIDDNLGLLSKLRPGFAIRPELTKKILLKKLI